ncbi:MAG: DUF2190 family protein [Candidatus Brocadiales bacterium]|nr:DUF2190 family protein [Candidatus Brocadiales bacterium]
MTLSVQHPGLAYGAGITSENLLRGQFVKLTGGDLFSKVVAEDDIPFGVVFKDAKSGELVTVYTQGGVYETELFDAGISAGDELEVNPATAGLQKKGATSTAPTVATAISVSGTTLKFKLLV